MSILLTILHVGVAITLILLVLLQAGKGAGIGAAFGGSSETLFGATGPQSFMSKLTAGAAVLFMVSSLLLSFFGAQSQTGSIVPATPLRPPTQSSAPANPGAPAAPQSQESPKPEAK